MIIRSLSRQECTKLLESNRLGRLACADDGQPYIVSIFYAYADDHLYAFTLPGRKLDTMRANPNVALLVEEFGQAREWRSVVAEGRFEELPDRIGHKRQRDHAWTLLSRHAEWGVPGALKPVTPPLSEYSPHVFFRIGIEHVSGREAKKVEEQGTA